MKFKSNLKQIRSGRVGLIEFKRGTYSTDDPREIAVLRSHPAVSVVAEKPGK